MTAKAVVTNLVIGAVSLTVSQLGCPAHVWALHARPRALATADFNADGLPDLAVANAGANTVGIFLATPSGLPTAPSQTLRGTARRPLGSPRGLAVGDFDNDGRPDLAVANYRGRSVSVFLGHGDGSFSGPTNYRFKGAPAGIAAGQFHTKTSSNVDLIVATRNGKVHVLTGSGSGSFTVEDAIRVGKYPTRVAVGHFCHNGSCGCSNGSCTALDPALDAAVTLNGEGNIAVLYGHGDGRFTVTTDPADVGGRDIVAADLNGDGCPDLATVNRFRVTHGRIDYGATYNRVDVFWCVPTNGGFNAYGFVDLGSGANAHRITAADLTPHGDGRKDLAVTDTGGPGTANDKLVLLQNNGAWASFNLIFTRTECPPDNPPGDMAPIPIVIADFTGDTIPDFAVGNNARGQVAILTGNGMTCPTVITDIGQ